MGPWAQCYKKIVCSFQIFVISYRLCPWQGFQDYSNKHSSFVQTIINYGQENVL
jgi:hypothetical protein